eukprot:scaffold3680_cov381-Prasinococcus_capsulatus_cf.AAC.5
MSGAGESGRSSAGRSRVGPTGAEAKRTWRAAVLVNTARCAKGHVAQGRAPRWHKPPENFVVAQSLGAV